MVGTTISHFKVLEKIGQGGMGEVAILVDILHFPVENLTRPRNGASYDL